MKAIPAALVGLTLCCARAEDLPLNNYVWRQSVQGSVVSGQLYRVKAGDAIFDGCHAFPADVRIAGADGGLWPFFLWTPTDVVEEVTLKTIPTPATDIKSGIQTIVFDLGVRHVPLHHVRIQAADEKYARPLKIFGRNAESNMWRWVGDGGVHHLGGQVREEVLLRGCEYRWLKLELYNYEEPPLNVTNVVAVKHLNFLVFEARGDRTPYVYFSSPKFSLPHYDLRRRTTDAEAQGSPLLELGRRRMTPERLAMSIKEYGWWLAAAAAAIVGTLTVITLVNLYRRRMG